MNKRSAWLLPAKLGDQPAFQTEQVEKNVLTNILDKTVLVRQFFNWGGGGGGGRIAGFMKVGREVMEMEDT